MKKIVLITSLFLALSSYCQEQQDNLIAPIVDQIKQIVNIENPRLPKWDLETFLSSEKAAEFRQKIEPLSQTDKSILMRYVAEMEGGDSKWPIKRDFWALAVESGGDVNANVGSQVTPETLLTRAAVHSDLPAVKFALERNADTNIKSVLGYPLEVTSNYDIAKLLVDKGALAPFKDNPSKQLKLLEIAMRPNRPYQLLEFYANQGLGMKWINNNSRWTLLHTLCSNANATTPFQFFEKFKILYKDGAINVNALNNHGQTALDIIKNKNQSNSTIKLARRLLEDLEKKQQRENLELLRPKNPVGLQELLYTRKNPYVLQPEQLELKK